MLFSSKTRFEDRLHGTSSFPLTSEHQTFFRLFSRAPKKHFFGFCQSTLFMQESRQKNGGGGGSRTRDLLFRREPLYPTELRHRFLSLPQKQNEHPQRAVPDVALGLDLFNDRFTGPFYVCFRASIYYSPVSAKIKRQSEKRGISLTYH